MPIDTSKNINPFVRNFILSEFFVWTAWNSIIPIFSIFFLKAVPQSNIMFATSAYSFHLILRIIVEFIIGRKFPSINDNIKIFIIVFGACLMSASYLGFAFLKDVVHGFIFYGLLGVGAGAVSPPKYSLFSTHLDIKRETYEWSLYDVVSLGGMAIASFLAGIIVHTLGFQTMFALAAFLNFLSILPYLLLLDFKKS